MKKCVLSNIPFLGRSFCVSQNLAPTIVRTGDGIPGDGLFYMKKYRKKKLYYYFQCKVKNDWLGSVPMDLSGCCERYYMI